MPFQAIASIANGIMNAMSVHDTNMENRRSIAMQNYQNLQQWKRENAYNHPVNQVQRLKAAGLNLGLLYGQPPVNTSAPSPTMQSSRDIPTNYNFVGPDVLGAARTMAEIKNINANTKKQEEEAKTEALLREDTKNLLIEQAESLRQSNRESIARIQRLAKENEVSDAQIKTWNEQLQQSAHALLNDDARLKNETKLNNEQIKLVRQQTRKALAEAKVSEREYTEMLTTYELRFAGLLKSNEEADARISQAKATARKLGIESDLESFNAAGNAKLAEEFGEGSFGATTLFLLSDGVNRLGKLIHK